MRCSRWPTRSCCEGRADAEGVALGRDGAAILGVEARGGAAILGVAARGGAAMCGIGRGAMAGRCGGAAGRKAGAAGRAMAGGRAIAGGAGRAIGGGAGRAMGGAAGRAIGACAAPLLGSWACAPTLAATTMTEAPNRKAAKRPPSGSMVAAPFSSLIARTINARSPESSSSRYCDFATQATRDHIRGNFPGLGLSRHTRATPR